jgi:hypothetical protein
MRGAYIKLCAGVLSQIETIHQILERTGTSQTKFILGLLVHPFWEHVFIFLLLSLVVYHFRSKEVMTAGLKTNLMRRANLGLKFFKPAAKWLMPVIPATQEAEIRRIVVQSQPRQIVL